MLELFDNHAHYDDEKFNEDRDEIIRKVHESGVTKFISAGYSLEGSRDGLELAKQYDYIYTTAGISPNDLSENFMSDINEINRMLEKEQELIEANRMIGNKLRRIVAVGEIGLDYHYDTDKDWQKKAFKMQIDLANKHKLPIVIHTRDAVMDTLQILKDNPVDKKGVFHCCPFNRELVKEALKMGFYISIAGPVTFKNSKNAEEIVNMIPLDRILIETDSPYLAPEPVRGTRNDSRNVRYIAQKIADFRNMKIDDIAKYTYNNACKIYNI